MQSVQSNNIYSGNNNYHANMPALMSDSREQSSWYMEAAVDNNIKKAANITSNWEYRKYLTNNATHLMDINARNALMENPEKASTSSQSTVAGTPYVYRNVDDRQQVRPGVFSSDLKTAYLNRDQLQAKAAAPGLYSTTSR
jgi:hypothetical protein